VIEGNECYGLYADDMLSTSPVDGTNNWWGHASGPSGTAFGTGDGVSEHVAYLPWTGFDASGDADADGWPNFAEAQAGTNPYDKNSAPAVLELYVGGTGADDLNLGTADHPLRSLHGAMKRINGLKDADYVIRLSPGVYSMGTEGLDEPLTVDQNVTIVGSGAVLDGSGSHGTAQNPWITGVIISAGAERVTIQGATIQNFEQGIRVSSEGGCLNLVNVRIFSCKVGLEVSESYQLTVDLGNSQISGCETGARLAAGTSNCILKNGVIRNNIGDGVRFEGGNETPDQNRLENLQLIQNGANGIIFLDGSNNTILDCLIQGNNLSRAGFGGIAMLG